MSRADRDRLDRPERERDDGGRGNGSPDDSRLAILLREGLAARDRAARTPRFAALWRSDADARASAARWRPVFAASAVLIVLTALSWAWLRPVLLDDSQPDALDATLAHELSSPDYWRVPTDELLAFAAPPLSAELPGPTGLEISLEESLL
jgi:hypothetical protein